MKAKGDCPGRVHSTSDVLGQPGREAGPCKQWPKALKTKLSSTGAIRLESLRSNGSRDGQAGGWTT
jgi:hypothetical protein